MTKQTRRKFMKEFSAKVALEAAKDQIPLAEIGKKYEVSPIMISRWKSEFLANMAAAFKVSAEPEKQTEKVDVKKLYPRLGNL